MRMITILMFQSANPHDVRTLSIYTLHMSDHSIHSLELNEMIRQNDALTPFIRRKGDQHQQIRILLREPLLSFHSLLMPDIN